ncbi:unnamed protein product [Thlaspi arvense]|uniref:Uncharacterized protein n=1 Tax=Thlaspi arvense TaxID=13288 RepID=A0AAU9RN50_THLAR|nr:unnamed protein product [Thlaspi arvense]
MCEDDERSSDSNNKKDQDRVGEAVTVITRKIKIELDLDMYHLRIWVFRWKISKVCHGKRLFRHGRLCQRSCHPCLGQPFLLLLLILTRPRRIRRKMDDERPL